MADKDKVIEGLEHCDFGSSDTCYEKECPYYQSNDCTDELKNDILALLNEPLTIKQEMFDEFYGAVSCCPKCDCMWVMYIENDMHYCPKCGQAVKWECLK